MLRVLHSNRLERLFDSLAGIIRTPLGNPLQPETVVVQNPGMGRWLTMELARRFGIAANIAYPLPAGFVWDLMRQHTPGLPQHSGFERPVLTWRIMDLLPEVRDGKGFEAIDIYLGEEPDELKWCQLAQRLADLFDQYLVYRPDWIREWEAGGQGHWQARLWRRLTQGGEQHHRAGLLHAYVQDLEAGKVAMQALPERIFVFGMAALPPLYLSVLDTLGRHTQVYLFVLNPCLSYWGDLVDEKSLARLQTLWRHKGWRDVSQLYAVGNSLLASLGKLGRDSLELVHETHCDDLEAFDLDLPDSLLGQVQRDILLLQEYGRDRQPGMRTVDDSDRSIEVHACHGPMREVEVLYDQLLGMLDANPHHPGLHPSDIVVMMPDIDAYAPYIEAVFGSATANRFIPWSIADRSPQSEHPLVQTFLQLLDLPASRFEASQIVSLLEVPAIRRKAGLDESGLEKILTWIHASGIRWGLDRRVREAMGIPDSHANTWHFGLERLLLGYAMPAGSALWDGISPCPGIEGSEGEDLGRLQAFIDRLGALARRLAGRHPPQEWRLLLGEVLALFDEGTDSDEAHALQLLRTTLDAFAEQAQAAAFAREMGVEVIRDNLDASLRERAGSHRFLSGGVTFCRMTPLRSIPFRVVCLLGMDDLAYPRQNRPPAFDLIARDPHPRRGDRSRRADDRYLFLEALLSAREKLYISHVGRNLRDNSRMLPSVLVSELLDYLENGFCRPGGALRDWLVVEHPMQPFSRTYRHPGSPFVFSYSERWLGEKPVPQRQEATEPVFMERPLDEPDRELLQLDIDTLVRFLKNPARYFLYERLRLRLGDDSDELDDAETFRLEPLPAYDLRQQCLEQLLDGTDEQAVFAQLTATGILPHGEFGRLAYQQQCTGVHEFADAVRSALAEPLPPLDIDLRIGDCRLSGRLGNLTRAAQITYRFSRHNVKDLISLWIRHLVLNLAPPDGYPGSSRHLGSDGQYQLRPAPQAHRHLEDLLYCYREGLTHPLPFFPRSSLACAEKHASGASLEKSIKAASYRWASSTYTTGEDQDPWFALATRGRDALDEAFADTAVRILGPALAHLER